MSLSKCFLVLQLSMFLACIHGITNGEVQHKITGEPSASNANGYALLTRFEASLKDLKKREITQRHLVRRAIDKSGKETSESDKELPIDHSDSDNSTARKLTGEDSEMSIPLTPGPPGKNPKPPPFIPPPQLSCSKSVESCRNRCSNRTRFVQGGYSYPPLCGCDTSCNDIFMDCCSDYTEHCGSNTEVPSDPVYDTRSYLECETKLNFLLDLCELPDGVWMVKRCPRQWFDNDIRRKCEAPPTALNSQTYDALVPVYSGINSLTYRNQYCAMCHNITSYEFWDMTFWERVTPPSHFNKKNLMAFLESSNAREYFKGVKPKPSFQVRYCYFQNFVKTCPNASDIENAQCNNGTVEIVHWNDIVYKNRACSSCHDVKSPCSVKKVTPVTCFTFPGVISRTVNMQDYGVTTVTKLCPEGEVYDPYMSTCRPSYQPLLLNSSVDSYKITMSVLRFVSMPSFNESTLSEAIAWNFNLTRRQIRNEEIVKLDDEFIIAFSLDLTPLQSLIMSSNNPKNMQNLRLWSLLNFETAFPLRLNEGVNLTVYRVRVRRLACIHWRVYGFKEYEISDDQRLYVKKSKITYEEYEFELKGKTPKSNAIVCSKLAPFHINGSYISLKPNEYTLLANLTLLHENSRYDFGEYLFVNGTVYVFVGFEREHEDLSSFLKNKFDNNVLIIVNFTCLVLSEIFLIALIMTFVLFKELRTLPGKNLLSLAISLALGNALWTFSGEISEMKTFCTVTAIATHYFYMVYFTASTVIAYHSCHVFGGGIAILPSSEEEKRLFVRYFLKTWLIPAVFVALFVVLDQTETFTVGYGSTGHYVCFVSTNRSKLYAFVLPIALALVINIYVFVRVSKRFFADQKSNSQFLSSELQRKRSRQNVLICIRLSTLMGFSWLFIFLHLLFESETQVFLYLFVVFVSLQGAFVGVAFVFNRKCLNLYRRLITSKRIQSTSSRNNSETAHRTDVINQDTKL